MYELLRETEVDLKRYLPDFLFTDPSFMKVMEALNTYQEQQRQELIDVFKQFFISSATWGLTDWERVYGIAPESGSSYDIRRAALKIKKAGAATITNQLISWMINQYCPKGDARYIDNAGDGYAIVELNSASSVEAIRKTLDTYVPAHILFDIIARPARQIAMNRSGPLDIVTIPGRSWTESIPYTIYAQGLNEPGAVSTRADTHTATTEHSAYIFPVGGMNGKVSVMNRVATSRQSVDRGHDETTTYQEWTGTVRMNSRASPLNSSGAVYKRWTDVGKDHTVVVTLFAVGMNSAPASAKTVSHTNELTEYGYRYLGARMNGHVRAVLNDAEKKAVSEQHSSTVTRTDYSFPASSWRLNNGTLNSCRSEQVTQTNHIPQMRYVTYRDGGKMLNQSPHRTIHDTQHIANWQYIYQFIYRGLNNAAKKLLEWQTSKNSTTHEAYFTRPKWAFNGLGTTYITKEDVGSDVVVTDRLFHGGLNQSLLHKKAETQERTIARHAKTFDDHGMNARTAGHLNDVPLTDTISQTTNQTSRLLQWFTGGYAMNGRYKLNGCDADEVTRTIHLPMWRNVLHRQSESVLNSVSNTKGANVIGHKEPDRIEKSFSPKTGTLLNDKAVLGYVKL